MFKLYIFDEVNQDYRKQIVDINNKVQQYQQKLDKYNQKLHAYGDGVVDSHSIIQKLTLESEPNAKLTISNINNVNVNPVEHLKFNLLDDMGDGYSIGIKDGSKTASFDATFTN